MLNDPELPQFGDETKKIIYIKDKNIAFFCDDEIRNKIIYFDKLENKELNEGNP